MHHPTIMLDRYLSKVTIPRRCALHRTCRHVAAGYRCQVLAVRKTPTGPPLKLTVPAAPSKGSVLPLCAGRALDKICSKLGQIHCLVKTPILTDRAMHSFHRERCCYPHLATAIS